MFIRRWNYPDEELYAKGVAALAAHKDVLRVLANLQQIVEVWKADSNIGFDKTVSL